MNTKDLLSHLERLEIGLSRLSQDELKTNEASKLRATFERFKNGLEEKVFGVSEAKSTTPKQNNPSTQAFTESELICNATNEIKTPLNGLIGFVDLLKETELSEDQRQIVNAMSSASINVMDLINELMEFSKLASNQEKFESVSFNIANLIKEVAFLCETLINQKEVELTLDIASNIPQTVLGDPSKLSQVLLSLLGNAVQYVQKGRIAVEVNIKEEQDNRVFLEFLVSDTGLGIADEILKQIFDSYQQDLPVSHMKYGGSGLGLSIVKEIIEKQHGCISVSSSLGIGTTFRIIMPFEKDTQKPKSIPLPIGKSIISGTKVLVFEDDLLSQKLLEHRLGQWGCKTFITDNGVVGLQLLEDQNIDIVLLDMRLPGLNGLEIVKLIRSNKTHHATPIIALSADAHFLHKEELRSLGVEDFIVKPYPSYKLLKKIRSNIEREVSNRALKNMTEDQVAYGLTSIDLAPILEECSGKIELLEELIRLFEQNILEFIGKTKMHLQSRNLQGVGFAAHKIKSSLKMLNVRRLLTISEAISEECRTNNNVDRLKALYNEFVYDYPKVADEIDRALCALKYRS